jgi:hypothetical protein
MTNKIRSKCVALMGMVLLLTAGAGCSSLKSYSIRSYQGMLPLQDHKYVTDGSGPYVGPVSPVPSTGHPYDYNPGPPTPPQIR